jgi:hypothetical protein
MYHIVVHWHLVVKKKSHHNERKIKRIVLNTLILLHVPDLVRENIVKQIFVTPGGP